MYSPDRCQRIRNIISFFFFGLAALNGSAAVALITTKRHDVLLVDIIILLVSGLASVALPVMYAIICRRATNNV